MGFDILSYEMGKAAGSGGGGGSGGGLLVVGFSDLELHTLDKTWKEIHDSGYAVIRYPESGGISWETVLTVSVVGNNYIVGATDGEYFQYETDNENGYPVYVEY